MNSLFFWIIVLTFVVPTALRLYRKSVRGRNRGQGMPGGFPNLPDGGYPGQQSNSRGMATPSRTTSAAASRPAAPGQPLPPYPGQAFPGQPGYRSPVPYEDSPEYLNNPPGPGQQPSGQQGAWQQPAGQPPGTAAVPTPPSGPQGFRARKLAELDQRYSNGELAMEDYMAQRAEIMKG